MAEGDEADETPAGAFIVAFVFICLFRCMFCPRFVKHRKMEPCGRDAPLLWRCLMYGGCEAPDHPTPSTVTGERQAVCATVAEVQFDEPGPLGVQLQSRAAPSPSQSLSTEVLGAVAGSQAAAKNLTVGWLVQEINGADMSGRCFEDVMEHVRTPERPLHIQFAEEARTTAVGFADVPTVDAALVVPVGGGPVVEVAAVVEVAVVAVPPQP